MASPPRRLELSVTQTLPLTCGEETLLHLESASDPWNMQMEIGETQRIDPRELEAAVHAACMAHPIARSRLVVAAAHRRFDHWEIVDDLIRMSIPVVDCPDDATWPDCAPTFIRRRSRCTRRPRFVCKSPADRTEISSSSTQRMPQWTASACCGCSGRSPTHTGASPNPRHRYPSKRPGISRGGCARRVFPSGRLVPVACQGDGTAGLP